MRPGQQAKPGSQQRGSTRRRPLAGLLPPPSPAALHLGLHHAQLLPQRQVLVHDLVQVGDVAEQVHGAAAAARPRRQRRVAHALPLLQVADHGGEVRQLGLVDGATRQLAQRPAQPAG
jgi:hypothetical protein